jgi:AraC-like DNA-binding protein
MRTLQEIDSSLRANRRLLKVLRYVGQYPWKRLSLTQAAGIAGLERTYFCTYFKEVAGITFVQWDRLLRVERAKRLLVNDHLAVTAIALSVGYSDVTTFERNFRKCETLSPRDWRSKERVRITTSADKIPTKAETCVDAAT